MKLSKIVARVTSLAQANLSYLLKHGCPTELAYGEPCSPPHQQLLVFLKTLSPASLYALLALASLGAGAWRKFPDLLNLYVRWSDRLTPAEAIDRLMEMEALGKHLYYARHEMRRERVNVDRVLG